MQTTGFMKQAQSISVKTLPLTSRILAIAGAEMDCSSLGRPSLLARLTDSNAAARNEKVHFKV